MPSHGPRPRPASRVRRAGGAAARARRVGDGEHPLHQFTAPDWEQEDDITLVALERAAADPAVPRPVELGRPATAAAAIPLVADGTGPAGPARRVLVEEPTGTAEDDRRGRR
jgi:hypothetical protein